MNDMTMNMKLNHLSFPSLDVAATATFFEQYLGCTVSFRSPQAWILKRPGFDIVIESSAKDKVEWPHNFHLGFELPTVEAVRTLWEDFKADGVEIKTDFFKHERGSRFFCRVPGGVLVEINTREDADAPYRGTFN